MTELNGFSFKSVAKPKPISKKYVFVDQCNYFGTLAKFIDCFPNRLLIEINHTPLVNLVYYQ